MSPDSSTQLGTLYVVATPIGNLEDMTLRGLRLLKEANAVAAEDTRHTRKLFSHFDIHTPLVSFHAHSSEAAKQRLVQRLTGGEDIAMVTDAGTPGVSDPGLSLVTAALEAGITVTPIPGTSALLTALVGSGLRMDRFYFQGFLARRGKERRDRLAMLATLPDTVVIFEAPHRLVRTIQDLAAAFGDRAACAARELTKIHEEFIRAPLGELANALPETIRGEWTLLVAGAAPAEAEAVEEADWRADLSRRLSAGESTKDAAGAIAEAYGLRRKDVYAAALDPQSLADGPQ